MTPSPRLGLVAATALAALATLVALVTVLGATSGQAGPASAADDVVVLGSPSHYAPYGEGWGTVEPASVFNGGDPAGSVSHLTWTRWGSRQTFGTGLNPIFRPGGGYYRRPADILLRAQDLGTCADGTYGYRQLWFRVAHRPGGPLGNHWHRWGSDGDVCSRY